MFKAASNSGRSSRPHKFPWHPITSLTRFRGELAKSLAIAKYSPTDVSGTRRVFEKTHHGIGPSLGATVQRAPLRISMKEKYARTGPARRSAEPMLRR